MGVHCTVALRAFIYGKGNKHTFAYPFGDKNKYDTNVSRYGTYFMQKTIQNKIHKHFIYKSKQTHYSAANTNVKKSYSLI